MTTPHFARLVSQSLRRNLGHLVLASIGIVAGVGSLVFFLSLGAGVRRVLLGDVFPIDRLEFVPPRAGAGIGLDFGLGPPRSIAPDVARRIAERPEVRAAYPKMKLLFPARGWGGRSLLGRDLGFEVSGFLDGIEPALVAADVDPPYRFADLDVDGGGPACARDADCAGGAACALDLRRCLRPVPAVVSRQLLELYNGSIAPAHGWPRLSDWLTSQFRGLTFSVELGRSYVGDVASRGTPVVRRVQLVGISDKAVPLGLTVPLSYVRRWNGVYAGEKQASDYSSVVVRVRDKSDVTRLVAFARSLGLEQADTDAERVGLFVTIGTLLLGLIGVVIVAVAAINVAHTFGMVVAERRREIGVMRAVGASRGDIRALVLGEAAVVGLAGGAAGVVAARLLAGACDMAAARGLPDFPFKPRTFFHFSPVLVAGGLGFAVLCCLLGALAPARRAANLDPAAALAGP